jgi:hypothetical protein
MRIKWFLVSIIVIVLFDCALAQQAIVRRATATLRADPSTNEPPEATLHSGDKLMLLDATAEHVLLPDKTHDGKEGWVFSPSIRIIASPSSSNPATDAEEPPTGPAQSEGTL